MNQLHRLSVFFLLSSAVSAQCALPGPSSGPFAGSPFLYSLVDEAIGGTQMKCSGFGRSATSYRPVPGRPDLDIGTVIAKAARGAPPEIDAISFGLDVIVTDSSGRAVLPSDRWATLAFSVSETSVGSGGTISREARGAGGAAGDVFTYVLPGSALSPFGGVVHRAQDGTEFIPAGVGRPSVDALDLHAPLYAMDPGLFGELKGEPLTVYFSVSAATVGLVPSSWWSGKAPSGATILAMSWDWGQSRWTTPVAFLSAGSMELSAQDDIDALAVDTTSSRSPVVLFSTTDLTRDQLWIHWTGAPESAVGTTAIYISSIGTPVSKDLGLAARDDITALCEIDPTVDEQVGFWTGSHPLAGKHPMRFAMGWPIDKKPLGLPIGLDGTAFVTCDGGKRYDSWGIGWPAGSPSPGVAGLLLELPGPTYFGLTSILSRNVVPVFCGDPQNGGLGIENPPLSTLRMSGTLLRFHWLALDAAGGFVSSYPLLIHL